MTREEMLERITPQENKYIVEGTETIEVPDERYKTGVRKEEIIVEVIDYKQQEKDKELHFKLALQEGKDPLGVNTLSQLFDDWQFLRKFRRKYGK